MKIWLIVCFCSIFNRFKSLNFCIIYLEWLNVFFTWAKYQADTNNDNRNSGGWHLLNIYLMTRVRYYPKSFAHSHLIPSSTLWWVAFLFLKKVIIYLTALDLSCSMWNLVPWPGIEPEPPLLGVLTSPLDHRGSPWCSFVQMRRLRDWKVRWLVQDRKVRSGAREYELKHSVSKTCVLHLGTERCCTDRYGTLLRQNELYTCLHSRCWRLVRWAGIDKIVVLPTQRRRWALLNTIGSQWTQYFLQNVALSNCKMHVYHDWRTTFLETRPYKGRCVACTEGFRIFLFHSFLHHPPPTPCISGVTVEGEEETVS